MKPGLARLLATAGCAAVCAAGCHPAAPPGGDWPEGTLVVARTEALERLLAKLAQLEGTRVARRAEAVARALPDCAWVEGQRAKGPPSDVWSHLGCRSASSPLAGLDRERRGHDIAFALPRDGDARAIGTLSIAENGDVDAEIRLPRSLFASARALLLPSDGPAGPSLLSHADELVHARLRPEGGMDIAALVPESSQADRMFRLKSELFAGAVLDGTWEVAVYLPEPGRPMPRSALALGFSLKRPAVAAMERFVAELEAAWPVLRSEFAVGAAEGACLLELKLMPDLAPCYVATERALVVGWNPESVRQALAEGDAEGSEASAPHPPDGITVDLSRIPEADANFARLELPDSRGPQGAAYPWRRLRADGASEGGAVQLRLRLEAEGGA